MNGQYDSFASSVGKRNKSKHMFEMNEKENEREKNNHLLVFYSSSFHHSVISISTDATAAPRSIIFFTLLLFLQYFWQNSMYV